MSPEKGPAGSPDGSPEKWAFQKESSAGTRVHLPFRVSMSSSISHSVT